MLLVPVPYLTDCIGGLMKFKETRFRGVESTRQEFVDNTG